MKNMKMTPRQSANEYGKVIMLCVVALASCSETGVVTESLQPASVLPVYALDDSFPRPSDVEFTTVSWVTRDPENGLLYFLQRSSPEFSAWTTDGVLVSSWATEAMGDPHSLSVQLDSQGEKRLWVTDMAPPLTAGLEYGHCLKSFSLAGVSLSTIGACGENSQGTGLDPVQFDKVTDIAWDSNGAMVVTDGDFQGLNNRVLKLTADGTVLTSWSAPGDKPGSGPAQFNLPHAVIVDSCNRLWVADTLNQRVQVIGSDSSYLGELTSFGGLGVYALAFGPSFVSRSELLLYVGSSPTTGGGTGRISAFPVRIDCANPTIADQPPLFTFDVPIPASTSETLLHSIAVDPDTWDVYLTLLGGKVSPQKWTATWPSGQPQVSP